MKRRPRLPERTHYARLRLTDDEDAALLERQTLLGSCRSATVRDLVFDRPLGRKIRSQAIAQTSRIAANLEQLRRHAGTAPPEVAAALERVATLTARLTLELFR